MSKEMPPDRLVEKLDVLTRREIEARVLAPLIASLIEEFGRERVIPVVRKTIIELARKQGRQLADGYGNTVEAFDETLQFWRKGGALEIEIRRKTKRQFDFDVTRCRYAEMYRAMGIEEFGALLSCNRDYSLIEGFNPEARLERKQTILGGASCCTFRYSFPEPDE